MGRRLRIGHTFEKCVFDNRAVRQANYRILGHGFDRAI